MIIGGATTTISTGLIIMVTGRVFIKIAEILPATPRGLITAWATAFTGKEPATTKVAQAMPVTALPLIRITNWSKLVVMVKPAKMVIALIRVNALRALAATAATIKTPLKLVIQKPSKNTAVHGGQPAVQMSG